MGVVYEAEQTGPVSRRVALKVLKPGVDTKEVVARFEAERQALAVMDHPNIAKVFDAGVTEDGRPFFAMELVRGIRITDYCDQFKLDTRRRLELFVTVCQAVQHAHQKGVIHRDLKPSNMLVSERDDRPVAKIIDFGIAKAISQPLTERTLVTEYGRALGTPAYMSPEQAGMSGLDVDTRTDVYSLGVVLYELLVGHVPLDPRGVGQSAFLAQLVAGERDLPNPSHLLTSLGDQQQAIAKFRHTDPRSLIRELKGDLDWIVMKAVEKDRSRRYETANGLALDIERHLNDEPVVARPPSTAYRFVKFVQRHKGGVAAAVVVAAAIVIGVVTMMVGLVRATRAEAARAREAEAAQQVSDFLVGLFEESDPQQARGSPISVREVLNRGAEQLNSELQDQPVVQARLLATIGQVYTNMGLFDEAQPLLERSLELREAELGPDHLDVAESLQRLAKLIRERGEYADAAPLLERTIAIREQHLGPEDPAVAAGLVALGSNLLLQGRYREAQSLLEQALGIQERVLAPDDTAMVRTLNNLAVLFYRQQRYSEAEPFLERSLAIRERTLEPGDTRLATALNNLGGFYYDQKRYAEAKRAYERAQAIWEKALEPNHPDIAKVLNNLAEIYWVEGRYDEAESYFRRSLAIKEAALNPNVPLIARSLNGLANVYRDQRRFDEAEPLYLRALAIRRAGLEPGDSAIEETVTDYADMLRLAGRGGEAANLEAQARALRAEGR